MIANVAPTAPVWSIVIGLLTAAITGLGVLAVLVPERKRNRQIQQRMYDAMFGTVEGNTRTPGMVELTANAVQHSATASRAAASAAEESSSATAALTEHIKDDHWDRKLFADHLGIELVPRPR